MDWKLIIPIYQACSYYKLHESVQLQVASSMGHGDSFPFVFHSYLWYYVQLFSWDFLISWCLIQYQSHVAILLINCFTLLMNLDTVWFLNLYQICILINAFLCICIFNFLNTLNIIHTFNWWNGFLVLLLESFSWSFSMSFF